MRWLSPACHHTATRHSSREVSPPALEKNPLPTLCFATLCLPKSPTQYFISNAVYLMPNIKHIILQEILIGDIGGNRILRSDIFDWGRTCIYNTVMEKMCLYCSNIETFGVGESDASDIISSPVAGIICCIGCQYDNVRNTAHGNHKS
jgi:hypothetical protein